MTKVLDGTFYDISPAVAVEGAYAYIYYGSGGPWQQIDLGYRRYLNVKADSELVLQWPDRVEMHPLHFADNGGPLKLVPLLRSMGLNAERVALYEKQWRNRMTSAWEFAVYAQRGIASEHGLFLEKTGYLDWKWYRFMLRFADDGWFTLEGNGISEIYSNFIGKSFYRQASDFITELLTNPASMSGPEFAAQLESHGLLDMREYLYFIAGTRDLVLTHFVHTGLFY